MNEKITPNHVAIIMDGNRRWAKAKGLPSSKGHRAGADTLKKLCLHILETDIHYLSVYAFSTENFKREQQEVDYLMNLFIEMFKKEFAFLKDKGVRVVFSGRREPLSKKVLETMDQITEETKDNDNAVLNVCLNYGGHAEIIDMTKKISTMVKTGEIDINDINEELINKNMYNELPPVDFVIRTSGEMRTSNFLPWQSLYAEFYFPKVMFPDFDEEQFDLAIEEYRKRNRRFGGTK